LIAFASGKHVDPEGLSLAPGPCADQLCWFDVVLVAVLVSQPRTRLVCFVPKSRQWLAAELGIHSGSVVHWSTRKKAPDRTAWAPNSEAESPTCLLPMESE